MNMEHLEKAAQVFMAGPDAVTPAQRLEAQQVFYAFRNTKSPFNLCREILETSANEYVLFEASNLLRAGVIREWSEFNANDVVHLRQYIVQYVMSKKEIPYFVRETLVQVVGLMVKRGSVDDGGEDRGRLIGEIENIIRTGDHTMRIIGCSLLSAIMQEYAFTVKSTDVGLTWETHFQAKKRFEAGDLVRIFHFVVSLISESLRVETKMSPEDSTLLLKLTTIAEGILTWSFISLHLPKRLMSVFEADQNPSLRPSHQWRDTFMEQGIVQLFFKLYWRVRVESPINHNAMNCLVQLASLNGAVLMNKQARVKYLDHYLQCLFSFLESTQITESESLGLSHIFRKLLLFFPRSVLQSLPDDSLSKLIDHLARIICGFAEAAANEEVDDPDSSLHQEAFENALQSWSCILQDTQSSHRSQDNPNNHQSQICINASAIFDTYVKTHMAPPSGTRRTTDDEIIDSDVIDPDRVVYRDQLTLIGVCGWQNTEHSISVLTRLLEEKIGQLRQLLAEAAGNPNAVSDCAQRNSIHEDIHWILLICGHVCTMDNEGETALIPSEMVSYSISVSQRINIDSTLRTLAAPDKMPNEIVDSEHCDPLIRLLSNVLRVCETENMALSSGLGALLSPETSSTLMWFLRRFCLTYLLPTESFYTELSVAITSAFGLDSEGAKWTLNYLLRVIENVIRQRNAEPALIEDTVGLLITMSDSKERGLFLVKSEGLMSLIKLHQSGSLALLSQTAQRGIMQALVMCAAALPSDSRTQYWEHILDPSVNAFRSLVSSQTFVKGFHEEEIRRNILVHLDILQGAVQGCLMPTATCIFSRISAALADAVIVLEVCHNYPSIIESVMSLYVETGRQVLCYLSPSASRQLYEMCVQLIRSYTKHNSRLKTLIKSEGEEDQWRDLQLLIELLTSLLSKDIIDLAPTCTEADNAEAVAGADVCLFGLNILMPLMNREVLKLPSLCLQYFKMVAFIAEIYPSKVAKLDTGLLKSLLESIELALVEYGPEVGSLALDFLVVLGTHVHKKCENGEPAYALLNPFLKLVLDLILSQRINSDLLQSASAALYTLICCFQDDYRRLVQTLIESQAGDQARSQRLLAAFTELTNGVELTADRNNRYRFRDNFDTFIANVRGFLLVK